MGTQQCRIHSGCHFHFVCHFYITGMPFLHNWYVIVRQMPSASSSVKISRFWDEHRILGVSAIVGIGQPNREHLRHYCEVSENE